MLICFQILNLTMTFASRYWKNYHQPVGRIWVGDNPPVRFKRFIGRKSCLLLEDGRIYSEIRKRFLRPTKYGNYYHLHMDIDGKSKNVSVHILIACAWKRNNDPSKNEVNHIKGFSNHSNNLEWVTHQENCFLSRKVVLAKPKTKENTPESGKKIKEFPFYLITAEGNVYSIRRKIYLKKVKTDQGYLVVVIKDKNGIPRTKRISRLVYESFIGKIQKGNHIDHQDNDKTNNSVNNLKQVSPGENNYLNFYSSTGTSAKYLKKVEQIDGNTNKIINTFRSQKEASRITGISNSNISQTCQGNRLTAGGFIWKFAD